MWADYNVGQKLWFVPARGVGREVEIVKVGRKYAYFKYYSTDVRVEKLCAAVKDTYASGTLWESEQACANNKATHIAWLRLKNSMRYTPPPNVTIESIAKARDLLGLPE